MKKTAFTLGVLGVAFVGLGIRGVDVRAAASSYKNPLSIKQSGYGMTFARLSQDLIDNVWHMGQEHEHTDLGELAEVTDILGLEDLPGDHDHSHGHDDHGHGDDDHGHGHDDHGHGHKYGANDALLRYVAKDVERRFLTAYLMDPTNYGVYNGYFHFLTIHSLGGTPESSEKFRILP